jgi:hypothetical protein
MILANDTLGFFLVPIMPLPRAAPLWIAKGAVCVDSHD